MLGLCREHEHPQEIREAVGCNALKEARPYRRRNNQRSQLGRDQGHDKRQAIEGLKASLDALMQERKKRIKALERVVTEAEQRARYLGQFRIEAAGLYNMGAARSAVLRSWGIETAAEIDEAKIAEVPGFGRNLTDRLVNWRDGLERKFLFEPAAVADPLEVRKVDREIAVQRIGLMNGRRDRARPTASYAEPPSVIARR